MRPAEEEEKKKKKKKKKKEKKKKKKSSTTEGDMASVALLEEIWGTQPPTELVIDRPRLVRIQWTAIWTRQT